MEEIIEILGKLEFKFSFDFLTQKFHWVDVRYVTVLAISLPWKDSSGSVCFSCGESLALGIMSLCI